MLAKDIVTKELITVKRSTTLRDLIHRLKDFHTFPLVPVIDDENHLIGIFSFKNLIDALLPYEVGLLKAIPFLEREEVDIFDLDISPEMATLILMDDVMEKNFIAANSEDRLELVYNEMKRNSIEMLPVVDNEKRLIGMIGIFDVLVALFSAKGIIGGGADV